MRRPRCPQLRIQVAQALLTLTTLISFYATGAISFAQSPPVPPKGDLRGASQPRSDLYLKSGLQATIDFPTPRSTIDRSVTPFTVISATVASGRPIKDARHSRLRFERWRNVFLCFTPRSQSSRSTRMAHFKSSGHPIPIAYRSKRAFNSSPGSQSAASTALPSLRHLFRFSTSLRTSAARDCSHRSPKQV